MPTADRLPHGPAPFVQCSFPCAQRIRQPREKRKGTLTMAAIFLGQSVIARRLIMQFQMYPSRGGLSVVLTPMNLGDGCSTPRMDRGDDIDCFD